MPNERIELALDDRYFGQLAPSQASRTNFTPGKAVADAGEQNWPTDFLIPVGVPAVEQAGPLRMQRVRVTKLGRNTVCDQQLVSVPGAVVCSRPVQDNDGRKERNSGYDWPAGLV